MLNELKRRLKTEKSIRIRVKVVPNSSRTQIVGSLGQDTLKVRIQATPEKDQANKELVQHLAIKLGVPQSNVQIVGGRTSHTKYIKIRA